MAEIQTTLSSLTNTVIIPIYSWVAQFRNFINPSATWAQTCGSKQASVLDFDD